MLAHRAGGVDGGVVALGTDDPDPEAVLAAQPAQQIGIAAARLAELEIVPDDDADRAQLADQKILDEALGLPGSEILVEPGDDHRVHPGRLHQRELDLARRQAEQVQPGQENVPRVRLEGERAGTDTQVIGHGAGRADHRLMAAVDTIEVADGHDATDEAAGGTALAGDL